MNSNLPKHFPLASADTPPPFTCASLPRNRSNFGRGAEIPRRRFQPPAAR